jgi:hypothetical protein
VKPAEILHRLSAQYGKKTLSHANVYDWYSKFPEICKEVLNKPHAHIQPTSVCDVNVCFETGKLQYMILEPTVAYVGSVETIIHGQLLFKKVCARWVL